MLLDPRRLATRERQHHDEGSDRDDARIEVELLEVPQHHPADRSEVVATVADDAVRAKEVSRPKAACRLNANDENRGAD